MTSLLALVAGIKLNANREEAKGAGQKTCTILRFSLKLVCVKKKKKKTSIRNQRGLEPTLVSDNQIFTRSFGNTARCINLQASFYDPEKKDK